MAKRSNNQALKKGSRTPLGREALLTRKPTQVREFVLPDGDLVNYVVRPFAEVKEVLARFEEDAPGEEKMAVAGLLVVRSLSDPDGARILEDEDLDGLFDAMDMKNYLSLNRHIQEEYGLIKNDAEESENLSATPGKS